MRTVLFLHEALSSPGDAGTPIPKHVIQTCRYQGMAGTQRLL